MNHNETYGEPPKPAPKIRPVDRNQGILRPTHIDELIDEQHPARGIWDFVTQLDLGKFYDAIVSVEGEAGRSAFDPRMLVSVWVYAYSRGIGSAREISRLCETDPAFQWLTGFQSITGHTLSDFRVRHKEGLDELFAQVLGLLSGVGLIKLERVTQDGTKIRANASPKSFRRKERIKKHLEAAREHVAAMGDPNQEPQGSTKSKARKQAAARERAKRIERALNEAEKLQAAKGKPSKKQKAPKVSTTDPDARMMIQSDGGVLPSYNMQLSVDGEAKFIAEVDVTNAANDSQQLVPAMERLEQTFDSTPSQVIADGDYTNYRSVEAMAELAIDYYSTWKQVPKEPSLQWRGLSEAFYPQQFHFDSERDLYVCPAGRTLVYRTTINHPNGRKSRLYRATANECAACPYHHQCCSKSLARGQGRVVSRSVVPESVTRFQQKMQTEEAQQIYRQRSEVAEFPNLWIKSKFRLTMFHVRGLAKVAMVAKWAALAYNIYHCLRLRPSTVAMEATT